MPDNKREPMESATDHEILREIWCDVKDLKNDYDKVKQVLFGNGALGMSGKVNVIWGVGIAMASTIAMGVLGYVGWLLVK